MKSILTILLSILLLASLASCTDRQNQGETGGQLQMPTGNPTEPQTIEPFENGTVGGTNPEIESPRENSPEPQTDSEDRNDEMPLLPEDGNTFGGDSFNEGAFDEHSFEN